MAHESPLDAVMRLAAPSLGVFRGRAATAQGVTRKQLHALAEAGVVERLLPDTYRIVAVPPSSPQRLRAALLWAGLPAAAAGCSAAEVYGLEGVRPVKPEIVVPRSSRVRHSEVIVHRSDDWRALMIRRHGGVHVTGVEATLVAVAAVLDAESLEVACEDARRRGLTSVPGLRRYLERHGRAGRHGVRATRRLLAELDPRHPGRSTLEVKARRLLVAHGLTGFVREHPLGWNGRTYRFDFAFLPERTILETNGRRWHDDSADFERDQEKWSVPARHGFRLVFATWEKVTRHPHALVRELVAAMGE
jgi:very-short-patch-repair endonuclease